MPEIFSATNNKSARSAKPAISPNDHPSMAQIQSSDQTAEDTQPAKSQTLNRTRPNKHPDEYSEVLRKEQCSTNPMDSFAAKPQNIFFESQDKAEVILLLLRKHPLTLTPQLLGAFLFAIFPLFLGRLGADAFFFGPYIFAGYILWYMLLVGYLLETFLVWFFHVFIITDERIIDVDFLSMIYKRETAAKIDNIEDVSSVVGGAIRSIFNFGTVNVQTAGAQAQISFEDVPHPAKVKRLLNELLLEEEREKIEGRVN